MWQRFFFWLVSLGKLLGKILCFMRSGQQRWGQQHENMSKEYRFRSSQAFATSSCSFNVCLVNVQAGLQCNSYSPWCLRIEIYDFNWKLFQIVCFCCIILSIIIQISWLIYVGKLIVEEPSGKFNDQSLYVSLLLLQLERSFKFMKETEDQLKIIPQFCFPDAKGWEPVENYPR